jgi:hypothetical protein
MRAVVLGGLAAVASGSEIKLKEWTNLMTTRSKLALAALAATMLMSFAASTASARRIFLSNQRWLAIWPVLTLSAPTAGNTIRCPVTLEGSFHSATLSKVSGQLIGYVTQGRVNEPACTGGNARVEAASLPWHTLFISFSGTLPIISSVRLSLINATFEVEPEGGPFCRTKTTTREPAFGEIGIIAGAEAGNRIARTLTPDRNVGIELRGSFICEIAGRGFFEGVAEVFLQGSTSTRVLVRLVQ